MSDKRRDLELEIESESSQLEVSMTYPTDTSQFWAAIDRSTIRLNKMKEEYRQLIKNSLNP